MKPGDYVYIDMIGSTLNKSKAIIISKHTKYPEEAMIAFVPLSLRNIFKTLQFVQKETQTGKCHGFWNKNIKSLEERKDE